MAYEGCEGSKKDLPRKRGTMKTKLTPFDTRIIHVRIEKPKRGFELFEAIQSELKLAAPDKMYEQRLSEYLEIEETYVYCTYGISDNLIIDIRKSAKGGITDYEENVRQTVDSRIKHMT
ncbi:hypothetical protein KM043_009735 [Ampulex compressa]|nr:hypothetical protein KM043_009735 [Ampulex compressa]